MRTIDIEIKMMEYYGIRQNIIVSNAGYGISNLHECDLLILDKDRFATEIEIKINKGDLIRDKEKVHGHVHNHIKYFYFAVPKDLKEVALEHIPERAGLYIINKDNRYNYHTVKLIRKAKPNKDCVQWSFDDKRVLLRYSAIKIFTLKKSISKLSDRLGNRYRKRLKDNEEIIW